MISTAESLKANQSFTVEPLKAHQSFRNPNIYAVEGKIGHSTSLDIAGQTYFSLSAMIESLTSAPRSECVSKPPSET